MPTLVIKKLPEELHDRLKATAAAHRRSITQEAICLLEEALNGEPDQVSSSYWANRKRLPEFEQALERGAFSTPSDSTTTISEERDSR